MRERERERTCQMNFHGGAIIMFIKWINRGATGSLNMYTKGHFTHETESPWPLHFKHSHWWKWRSQSKFATSHYALRDQRSKWMQGGCRVYMESYMASNGSCFMVTWTTFKKHLLEVGLTQNTETMALQMFTTVDLFYFVMIKDPHDRNSLK